MKFSEKDFTIDNYGFSKVNIDYVCQDFHDIVKKYSNITLENIYHGSGDLEVNIIFGKDDIKAIDNAILFFEDIKKEIKKRH